MKRLNSKSITLLGKAVIAIGSAIIAGAAFWNQIRK
jgi:hypothetical protein